MAAAITQTYLNTLACACADAIASGTYATARAKATEALAVLAAMPRDWSGGNVSFSTESQRFERLLALIDRLQSTADRDSTNGRFVVVTTSPSHLCRT